MFGCFLFLRWILPVFFQTNSLLTLQFTDGSVGLTENVEGESRQFMVWLGTSVNSALVLHTFEVRSNAKFFYCLVLSLTYDNYNC